MIVSEAMTPRSELTVAELPGSRDDALAHLKRGGFSSLPVVKPTGDGERYRGLVSRGDLIDDPDEDQLALLMSEPPTVSADDDLATAAGLMRDGARRLPVVDGDGLVGIVTVTDVVRAIARGEIDGGTPVGELATRTVNAVHAGAPLPAAEREIALAGVPYAVVLGDDGEMVGILTEMDVIAAARVVEGSEATGESVAGQDDDWAWEGIKAVGGRSLPTRNVKLPPGPTRKFMTADVVTVSGRRTAREAAREMLNDDVEQLPLVSGGDLAGIVRDVDLLGGL